MVVVDGAEGGGVSMGGGGRRERFIDHFVDVDGEGAEHDYGGGGEDTAEERLGEHAGGFGARWEVHDAWIDGLDAEGLGGWTVHEDVCSSHIVRSDSSEYIWGDDLLIHSICIAFRGFLNPKAVLISTNDNAATLVLS